MTLDLYMARRFLRIAGQVLVAFFGMMFLIEIVEQLRRNAAEGLGLAPAARLALLSVPSSLYGVFPLIVMLGAVAMFVGLARSSELVVVRAAGRSGLRFLAAPATAALALGALAVAVLDPFVAAVSREYELAHARLTRGSESVLSVSEAGLWLRQGGAEGQTVIHAARADGDGTRLHGVTFLAYGPQGEPVRRVEAAEAVLARGAWELREARIWDLTAANPERSVQAVASASLPSDLTRERIREGFGAPGEIGFWDLPAYVARIEAAGFSARPHRVWMQMELAQPLMLAAMVLLAAGFCMRHARFGQTGQMVLLAVLSGFAIFFLRNFAQVLGEKGQIPVVLAAWGPPVAAALLAIGLLLHVEDG